VMFTSAHLYGNVYMRVGVARALDETDSTGAKVCGLHAGWFVRFWASGGAKFTKFV